MSDTATTWTCHGDVRGDCGIRHRSYETALQHCRCDDRAVKTGHGADAYSDRRPREETCPDE